MAIDINTSRLVFVRAYLWRPKECCIAGHFILPPTMSNASPSVLPLFNSPTSGEQLSQAATATTAQEVEENAWEDESPPAGYPRLAEKMSRIPEIAIFRRFGSLNAQNLLYLQAELVSMEKRLQKFQGQDSRSGIGNRKKYARNWYFLSQSRKDGNEKQWKLVRQIRQVLKEYSEGPNDFFT